MITRQMLIQQLVALQQGTSSTHDVADWAAQIHLQYENGVLVFEPGYEQLLLTTLINLIHNEDPGFLLDSGELQQQIAILESASAKG